MTKKVVLDASAILALIQEEPGAEVIRGVLSHSVMSAVNVAETLISLQKIGIPPGEGMEHLALLISEIVHFDVEQALDVAVLYAHTKPKGLSLGDRTCLALGKKLNAPIYTADKVWAEINLGLDIKLIR